VTRVPFGVFVVVCRDRACDEAVELLVWPESREILRAL
jgi:hypothetical protein